MPRPRVEGPVDGGFSSDTAYFDTSSKQVTPIGQARHSAVASVAPCPKEDVDSQPMENDCLHQYSLNHDWDPIDTAAARMDCENAPREVRVTWYPDLALCTNLVLKSR